MKKFIILVLDGFGVGAMEDVAFSRVDDKDSNTFQSILHQYPNLELPNLAQLGLMNIMGFESKNMKKSIGATYGKSRLMHPGADTFMGHQEIMGTRPKSPKSQCFQESIKEITLILEQNSYDVEVREVEGLQYLVVNRYCVIADNIDSDVGMAFNCIAPLDYLSFEELKKIASYVRKVTTINRIIPFGGKGNTIEDIISSIRIKDERYIGVVAVKSKSYLHNYQCLHMGFGVNTKVQLPYLLSKYGIQTSLIGKVADVVENESGERVSCVPTNEVLDLLYQRIKSNQYGFICANVQETDLAGHSQNVEWYATLLELVDKKLGKILSILSSDDILVVMADHGNDPLIGHTRHTREHVPVLIAGSNKPGSIGVLTTMSDVSATAASYLGCEAPENGTSFLPKLM